MDSGEEVSTEVPFSPDGGGIFVNYPYDSVYYDRELLTQSDGYLDSSTSNFTWIGLPQSSSSSSSPDSVIHIDVSMNILLR